MEGIRENPWRMKLKNVAESGGCIGSSSDEEEALACNGQSEVAPGLGECCRASI
jgi:hypothetical protein